MNKLITTSAPEKVSDTELYVLLKSTNVIFAADEKIHIRNDEEIWPVVSERTAVLMIRGLFADPAWQPHLSFERVRRLLHSLKSDPDLQKSNEDFVHEDLIQLQKNIWCISKGRFVSYDNSTMFSRIVKADVMKAIFLIGPANCGKSVILRFIQRLVGDEYVSNVSLANFSHRFSVIEMYDKMLNISGEVPSGMLSSTAFDVFKAITGGDRVNLERKGQQPFYGVVNAKLLFAGNMLPVFAKVDGTDSFVERLHILIFDQSVEEKDMDKGMEEKLWAANKGTELGGPYGACTIEYPARSAKAYYFDYNGKPVFDAVRFRQDCLRMFKDLEKDFSKSRWPLKGRPFRIMVEDTGTSEQGLQDYWVYLLYT